MLNYGPICIPNGDELCLQYYNYGFRDFLDFGFQFIVALSVNFKILQVLKLESFQLQQLLQFCCSDC